VHGPGKKTEHLTLGEWGDSTEIHLQVLSVLGAAEGNHLWIQGAVHGDELNCAQIAIEVFKRVDAEKISGTITILPVANPIAFQQFQRVSPIDDLDLNREYPGDANGFLTQRMAHLLLGKALASATAILDLHTGGMRGFCPPYVIYQAEGTAAERARELALNFGTEMVIELPGGSTPGRLSAVGAARAIPALTVELGGGATLQHDMVELGVQGVFNTLITLGMLKGEIVAPPEQVVYTKRQWVRTDRGGMCRLSVAPADSVVKGQAIATIEDLSGDILQELRSPIDGRVTLLRTFPAVRTGDWIALIADGASAQRVRRSIK
jgi:predicted deacylase